MLEPFKGELLLHPAALEYSANHCSNNCAYCFANARDAARVSSPKSLIDLVFGRSRAQGLTAWLYNNGYPICISNRTDPLCSANIQDSRTVFAALNDSPNGIFLQTKGCRDASHVFLLLDSISKQNVAFYVTITSRRDDILSRIEPGAASYAQRLDLLKYARARSWPVIVGLNPIWRPWMDTDDLRAILDDCIAAGCQDFVAQPLHVSSFALERMPRSCRLRLHDDELDGADGAPSDNFDYGVEHFDVLDDYRDRSLIRWMPTFFSPSPAHVFDATRRALGTTMISIQDFYDFAAASPVRFFTFADFLRVMTAPNPAMAQYGARNLNGYLYTLNRSAWKNSSTSKSAYSFADVYREIWNNPAYVQSPQRIASGGFLKPFARDDGSLVRDAANNLVLVKCDYAWRAWEQRTMTISDLKGKGVIYDG